MPHEITIYISATGTSDACSDLLLNRDVLLRHYRLVHGIFCEPRKKGRPKLSPKQNKAKNCQQPSNKEDLPDVRATMPSPIPSPAAATDELGSSSEGPAVLVNETIAEFQLPQSPNTAQPTFMLPDYQLDQDLSLLDWMNGEENLTPLQNDSNLFFPELSGNSLDTMATTSFFAYLPSPINDGNMANSPSGLQGPTEIAPEPSANLEKDSQFTGYTPRGARSSLTAQLQPFSIARCSSSDPWPLEWHTSREERRVAVPSLSPSTHGGSGSGEENWSSSNLAPLGLGPDYTASVLDETTRKSIVEILSLPFEHHPWQEDVKLFDSLPRPEILNHFVDLYFLRFHEFWPIIHRPTFKVKETPLILVLSMACIGACYSDIEKSGEFANTLAELCRRSAGWMAEYDSRFLRSPSYGIALLLQYIHAIGSGSRRLFEMADSLRSRLLSTGRYMNLFGGKIQEPPPRPPENTQHTWLEWISREQVKRFAWFLFEFDCLYVASSKQSPCIKLEDCPSELPCEQISWEAPTAFAWSTGLPWSESMPRGLPTSTSLASLLTELGRASFPFSRTDPLTKRLLVRCYGRLLENYQDLSESKYSSILWGQKGDAAVKEARTNISAGMTGLYETVWSDISQAINLRQTLRVAVAVHYSHIFAAGQIVDLITRAARMWAAGYETPDDSPWVGTRTDQTMDDALGAVTQHFKKDPRAGRELAWHASQVLCIQRRYPLNSPHEPLSVFLGGIILWAFAKCYIMTPEERNTTPVRLDPPMFATNPMTTLTRKAWIENGGRAAVESVGNLVHPEAPILILTVFAEMTQRLKVWGMGSKISGVFGRMLLREEEAMRS
ncbi:hypothetical protein B7463_g7391, partial [Scytalidium lignicola]